MGKGATKLRKGIDGRNWTEHNRWQSEEVFLNGPFFKTLVESSAIHDWTRKNRRPRVARRGLSARRPPFPRLEVLAQANAQEVPPRLGAKVAALHAHQALVGEFEFRLFRP